jgi:ferredoxin--NADP+ reductase
MRHIAIIGSGPAGYYTAEAVQKALGDEGRIDIFDSLPVPYGLIRSGVAPDHQSIKGVSRRYEKVALSDNVRFVGNVTVGQQVSIAELLELYDAVVLATGAPHDRPLQIPGETLGTMAIPNSPRSIPTCPGAPPWSSAWATWRSTSPGSCPRAGPNSPAAIS